jgi:chromosome segregation ATPase
MLEQIVHSVESQLAALGRTLWRGDPQADLREDVLQASDDLRGRHGALTRCRAEIETLRKRIADNQAAVVLLTSQIQLSMMNRASAEAWKQALELDKARQQLTADQIALPRKEQLCWSLEFKVRQMERRLAALQAKLYPSC